MGDNLTIKDLLGLIDLLKVQKNCQIVLIHNDSQLTEERQEEYTNLKEKVLDYEFGFNPSFKSIAEESFKSLRKIENNYCERCIMSIGLKNRRVIKKAVILIDHLFNYINKPNVPNEFYEIIVKSCLLLCDGYYQNNKEDYTSLKTYFKHDFTIPNLPKGTSLDSIISNVYNNQERYADSKFLPDGFVDEIDYYFKNGLFKNDDVITNLLNKVIENLDENSAIREFKNIWKKYICSFQSNVDNYKQELCSFLENKFQQLPIRNISDSINILNELDVDVDGMIDAYIAENKDVIRELDLEGLKMDFGFDLNTQLIEKIKNEKNKHLPPLDLESLLLKSRSYQYVKREIDYLMDQTPKQIYQWITSSKSKNLVGVIRGKLLNFSGKEQVIKENTISALKQVAQTDDFNKMKVKILFGINP